MVTYKKISKLLVLVILIIVCGINTNFFKNLAEVVLYKFDDRMINKYGFCSNESIGYLLYLKKKYEIKDNPKIVNYVHTPSVNWAIVNTENIDKSSKKLILLNYPGPKFKRNLIKNNNNLLELNNLDFLFGKFNKIESLEILNNSKNYGTINWKLNIITIDKFKNEKIIKEYYIKDFLGKSLKISLDILSKNLSLGEKKIYFKIKNKNSYEIKDLKIKVIFTNKYLLKDFQIIDKIDNCYYIE
jgi:hypothetical protein